MIRSVATRISSVDRAHARKYVSRGLRRVAGFATVASPLFQAAFPLGTLEACAPPKPWEVTAAHPTEKPALHPVQTRASFDLDCPAEQISIQEIGDGSMGAVGCGRRAAYVEDCDMSPEVAQRLRVERHCKWVLNSATTRSAESSGSPK